MEMVSEWEGILKEHMFPLLTVTSLKSRDNLHSSGSQPPD